MKLEFKNPALDEAQSETVISQLQTALAVLNDWQLTLKHAHWNVSGPNFIAVHEMLDPQIDKVRDFADEVGERIATLGGSPDGRASAIEPAKAASKFDFGKYDLGRDSAIKHLKLLDQLSDPLILGFRDAIDITDPIDVISSNILQEIVQALEFNQWFYRSHLING